MDEKRDMTAKEIAELDAEEYEEPRRDLMATKPAVGGEGGGGGRGDMDNPVAFDGIPGSMGDTGPRKIGSDEHNRLAKGRNA